MASLTSCGPPLLSPAALPIILTQPGARGLCNLLTTPPGQPPGENQMGGVAPAAHPEGESGQSNLLGPCVVT
jgi:hypothetical protein